MRQAGEVTFADAHKRRRNEGVVEFVSYSDMKSAYNKLNNTELSGKRIKLIEDRPHHGRSRSRSRSSSQSRSKTRSRSRSRSPHHSRSQSKTSRSRSVSRSRDRSVSKSPVRLSEKSRSRSPDVYNMGSHSPSKSPIFVENEEE